MGRLVGQKNTEGLLNSYDYASLYSMIKALRHFLRLEERALKGNDAAIVLMTDLKSGLGEYKSQTDILTPRQREVIELCLIEDLSETEVADRLNITQQSVHFIIKAGVRRIQRFLLDGKVSSQGFSEWENHLVIEMYSLGAQPRDIAIALNKSPRTIRNKIKYLKRKKAIEKAGGSVARS
jgi:DNA-binding CsgD family transcriptional regulator